MVTVLNHATNKKIVHKEVFVPILKDNHTVSSVVHPKVNVKDEIIFAFGSISLMKLTKNVFTLAPNSPHALLHPSRSLAIQASKVLTVQ